VVGDHARSAAEVSRKEIFLPLVGVVGRLFVAFFWESMIPILCQA